MSTLNTIYEYGEKFGVKTDKYYKIIVTHASNYFSKIDNNDILTYFVIFLVYISILFAKVNYSTKTDKDIRKNIDDKDNNTYIGWFFFISYGIVILKRLFNNRDISIYRSIILLFIIKSFYESVNKSNIDIPDDDLNFKIWFVSIGNDTLLSIINITLSIIYILVFIPLLSTYGDVPDFFYIGFVSLTSLLYLLSPVSRTNYFNIIKNETFSMFTLTLIFSLFTNISKNNSRTINVMNIVLLLSIVFINIFSSTFIHNRFLEFIKILPLQKSTIDSITNHDSISYIYANDSDSDCINFTNFSKNDVKDCDKYDYYIHRKNRINDESAVPRVNSYNDLYKFAGPFNIFIISQLIAMAIKYIFIYIILIKLPNPSKLYMKFFVYMFIINITIFYLNTMIKEYNLFNLRNTLYGKSTRCFVVDTDNPNPDNIYGSISDVNKFECINMEPDDINVDKQKPRSTLWIDLYNYIDYKDADGTMIDLNYSDQKLLNTNIVGLFTTIYGILYFLLVYTCDYLAFWNKIKPLKVIPFLILLIVIIIYIIVYSKDIYNKNEFYENIEAEYSKSSKLINIKRKDKNKLTKMIDDYNIKEIMNNILILTVIYTILFSTHKFYD